MHYLWKIIISVIFSCFIHIAQAQDIAVMADDSIIENASINWVRQFPSSLKEKNNRGVGKKIVEFVFGKKNTIELTRPVAVLAMDPRIYWILDQENGAIFKFQIQRLSPSMTF